MKKLMAMLLALILVLGMTACGGSTTTPPDVLDSTTVPETPEAPETPAPPSDPESPNSEDIWQGDYETATFADVRKYGFGSTGWDGSLPLTETGEQLSIGLMATTRITNFDTNDLTLWIEETTGIDLVCHTFAGSGSDVAVQIGLMMSGGEELPDIILSNMLNNTTRSEYVREGYLINVAGYYMTDSFYWTKKLNEICEGDPVKYINFMNGIENYSADMETGLCFGPAFASDNPTDAIHTETLVNTEWLQKLNLKAPTTVDELYNVLVAFRDQDPNGNGKKDEVPLMGLTHTNGRGVDGYIFNAFIPYAASRYANIDDNGKAYSPWITDEYRQALIFTNKLVKERLLRATTFVGTENDLKRMLNPAGDDPYTVGIVCAWITGDFQAESNSIHVYEAIPALSDATGKGGYSLFDSGVFTNRFCITQWCENPRLAWRFMDYMCSDEAFMRQRWGKEGVDWDWIENTEFKDQAKGNGIYGGDADWVLYQVRRPNCNWGTPMGIYTELSPEQFYDASSTEFSNVYYKKSADNVRMQQAIGEPVNQLLVFTRTPEEDGIFETYNADVNSYYRTMRDEFCMGYKDPNDDAVWNEYVKELESLGLNEILAVAQASFDRQQADLQAYLERIGK